MNQDIKLGFLASGSGSSVESLLTRIHSGELKGFSPQVIVCNKKEAGIYERARKFSIKCEYETTTEDQGVIFANWDVDIILGLGYTNLVGDDLLELYPNRIWNIRPTLLPKHGGPGMYGLETHMSVLRSGDAETGPTVHVMSSEYDKGKILNQEEIMIPESLRGNPSEENAKLLQKLVLQREYEIMPETLDLYRRNKLDGCRRFNY